MAIENFCTRWSAMVATDDRRTQTGSAGGEPEEGTTTAADNVTVMLAENCGTSAYPLRFRVETPRPRLKAE